MRFLVFKFDDSVYSMQDVLSLLETSGYSVLRTNRLNWSFAEKEIGYQVDGTDITISDPIFDPGYKINVISIFCPTEKIYEKGEPIVKKHDHKINKKLFDKLKRKFAMNLQAEWRKKQQNQC